MYIHVRVTADAKKEKVEVDGSDNFKISVKESAEQNRANRRVIELLAEHFGISTGKVRLINGHRMPSKIFNILD